MIKVILIQISIFKEVKHSKNIENNKDDNEKIIKHQKKQKPITLEKIGTSSTSKRKLEAPCI